MSLMQNPVTGSGSLLWPMFTVKPYGKCESSKKVLGLDHYLAMLIWALWWMLKTCTSLKGTLRLTIIEKYIFCLVWNILLLKFSEKHYQTTMNIDVKRKEIQFVWVNALVLFATIFFPIAVYMYILFGPSEKIMNEVLFIFDITKILK